MRPARLFLGLLLALAPGLVSGQTSQPAAAPITAGWNDGFFLQTPNGDYRLVIGLVAQTDGRFVLEDDQRRVTDTFTVRKMRPTFTGRVARYFDFKVMPDFGNGTVVLTDAYFDVRFSPKFRVRAGKDKTPVGYEVLIGDAFVLFPERSLATNLLPNRDVGFQAQGDLAGGRFFYAVGVFNGIPDGSSSVSDVDPNEGKDVAARMVLQPFRSSAVPASPLNSLGFTLGGSTGKQEGALPAFRTSAGQTYFTYATGATAAGERTRVTPGVFYYYKSLGAFGEFARSSQEVRRNDITQKFSNQALNVTGSFVLTGEPATDRGVRPRNNFDPSAGNWGALQLLGRYAVLTLDDDAFSAGFAGAGASGEAKSFTVALNWYPTPYIKYYATFERTVFDGDADGPRHAENAIIFRCQLGF